MFVRSTSFLYLLMGHHPRGLNYPRIMTNQIHSNLLAAEMYNTSSSFKLELLLFKQPDFLSELQNTSKWIPTLVKKLLPHMSQSAT
jgi:hypothetical protein